jgi:hypothetical protein
MYHNHNYMVLLPYVNTCPYPVHTFTLLTDISPEPTRLLERYGHVEPLAAVVQDPQSKAVFLDESVRAVFLDMLNKTELYKDFQVR